MKCVCGCTNMPSVLFRPEARQLCIPLPRNWQVVNQVGDNFLMCNEEIAINLMNGVLINPVPDSMLGNIGGNDCLISISKKTLSHLGNIRFATKANGGISVKRRNGYLEIRWARISAHRYAARGRQSVFSGQPELAATFTFCNIHTGVPILSLRTGGTTVIQRRGSHAYLYTGVGQRKSQLICVDLISGNILDEMELPRYRV